MSQRAKQSARSPGGPRVGARDLRASAARAAIVATILAAAWLIGWLPALEAPLGDLLVRSLPDHDPRDARVAAVVIDDRTLDELGPLPIPRDRLAAAVRVLAASGASGIVLDLILAGPAEGDDELAQALSTRPHVLAAAFDDHGGWLLPESSFGGARDAAHAFVEIGSGGVARTIASTKQRAGLALPALSVAAARLLRPEQAVAPGAELRPAFQPAPSAIPSASLLDLVNGAADSNLWRGRLVFIGISATGVGDRAVIPSGLRGRPVPGVLVHASATESLIAGRLLAGPGPATLVLGAFAVAFAVELLRSVLGTFRPSLLIGLGATVVVTSIAAASMFGALLPVGSLVLAVPLAALLREGAEVRATDREATRQLRALAAAVGHPADGSSVRGAAARLAAVRTLQEELTRRSELQNALLDGLDEGVVLWDAAGDPLLANRAWERLWGAVPSADQLIPGVIERDDRLLQVATADLGTRKLGLVRDVTADHRLEIRKREMQRLVSHELRTPLASVAGLADMLGRYELDRTEQRRVAELIGGESRRLVEMTGTFLDLERLAGGGWPDDRRAFDLAELVAGRCAVLAAAAATRHQTLSLDADGAAPVRGTAALLERVVDNLVGNALKFSPEGSAVEVEVAHRQGTVRLEISDHGPGIPEEARDRLFERFYRVPGSSVGGSGLGLAFVREAVLWHGGRVFVTSEIGRGSTFTVELPATGEEGVA